VTYQQIQAAKAGFAAAYFNYAQTVRSVFVDVDNSLTKQQESNKAYANQLNAFKASIRAYNLALERYKAGARDSREVVNAQINVDKAKLDLTLAKMQQLTNIVDVYQALGGGYKTLP